jgi:hypothetical protein
MRRRRLLAVLGTAAAGGAAATGTGAFTSVEANRAVEVRVADDADALLGLEPSPGPNGEYATSGGGELALSLADTDAGGSGLGTDSTYEFDDVFRVRNRGTQPVYFWAELDYGVVPYDADDLYLYPDSDTGDRLRDADAAVLGLDVGEAARVGVYVDTTDVAADATLTATLRADAERPAESSVTDPGGDLTGAVVSESPTGDQFGSIGAAVDAVTESTVYVESGTYEENLAVGSPDAGTDPASAPDAGVTITAIGDGRPTVDGYVQVLDPDVTLEGLEVTGEVFGYGVAAFEPGVTLRDVTVSGATNGIFLPSKPDVRVESCLVENYSFYGMLVSGRDYPGGGTPTVTDTTFDGLSGGGAVGLGVVDTPAAVLGNTATGNEFQGGDGAGIAHFSGAGTTLRENVVEGNDDGLFLAGPDAGTVDATRNDLVGNVVGVANEGTTAVTATECWWGRTDGPGAGTNGTGTEGPVTVEPWSTAPGPDWNAEGTTAASASAVEGASETVSTASVDDERAVPAPPADPRPRDE